MGEKYRRLLRDTGIFAIGSFGTRLILFFLLPVYTYFLSTGEYGTVELVNTLTSLAMPVLSCAVVNAVLRFGLDRTVEPSSVLRNAVTVLIFSSLLALVLTPVFRVSRTLGPYRWYLTGNIIFGMTAQVLLTYLKATGRPRLFVALGLVQTGLQALLMVLFLPMLKLGIRGCLLAGLISSGTVAVLAAALGHLLPLLRGFRADRALLRRMLRYSAPLILSQLSWWIIESSDKLMLSMFLGSDALGLYSVAGKIPALLNVFIALFSQAWRISAYREYDTERDQIFFSRIFQVYTFGICLVCSCLLAGIRPFLRFYVGLEFYEAWKYVPCLLIASVFSSVSVFMSAVYGSLKLSVREMTSTLAAALANILLNLLLIPVLGISGAAAATAASYLFIAVYRLLDTRQYFRFPIHFSLLAGEVLLLCTSAWLVSIWEKGWISALVCALLILIFNRKALYSALAALSPRLQKLYTNKNHP